MQFPPRRKLAACLAAILMLSLVAVPAAGTASSGSSDEVELFIYAGEPEIEGDDQRIGWGWIAQIFNFGDQPITGYYNVTRYALTESNWNWGEGNFTVPATGGRGLGYHGFSLLPEVYVISIWAGNKSLTKRAVMLFGIAVLSPPVEEGTSSAAKFFLS